MDRTEISALLRQAPLFGAMTDAAIAAIADLAEPVAFAAGTALMEEGQPGDRFLVLTGGTADVTHGGSRIRGLAADDFLGEIALIDGRPRTATVTATTSVDALALRRDVFLGLIDRYPSVRLGVLMALTERIRSDARRATD